MTRFGSPRGPFPPRPRADDNCNEPLELTAGQLAAAGWCHECKARGVCECEPEPYGYARPDLMEGKS